MTKLQRTHNAQPQVAKATAQLDPSYNFEDNHSINLVEGHPNYGTAATRTRNISLGETAYIVVLQSDESDLEDICNKLYNNNEDTSGINLT
jgi:hypothetical protein